ncbi:hypothetical protein LJR039_000136 [Pseudorhodoferax sp. LjRoot39]|uniref:hypothetical protein n=1 Tax=Pseudorhodoferax sp. LjRoot39 TaxID=3342328 RepID=UPI003ECDF9AA
MSPPLALNDPPLLRQQACIGDARFDANDGGQSAVRDPATGALLHRWNALLLQHTDDLARLLTAEQTALGALAGGERHALGGTCYRLGGMG